MIVSFHNLDSLMSHYGAIGDTISCDFPYSTTGFRSKLSLRYPPSKACLWTAIGPDNTVRQGSHDRCLAIGEGYFSRVTKLHRIC